MKETRSLLDMLYKTDRPELAPPSKHTVWVRPFITAEISYNELNPKGTFRRLYLKNLWCDLDASIRLHDV